MWKADKKSLENDDFPPQPEITYRHLLSTALGVRDPLRVVALCDSDAFYAACEMVRLGVSKDTPLVVLQWDSIIAVNYPAREYGITRFLKSKEAKKKCPDLRVVHVATYKEGEKEPGYWDDVDTKTHKERLLTSVSLDYYRRESSKVHALLKEVLPGAEIERASIDEAFIDFTRPVREKILERYGHLSNVPPNATDGLDTPLPAPPPISWDELGHLFPVQSQSSEGNVDPNGSQGCGEGHDATNWHDVALSIAADMMLKARTEIYTKLGYSTSAGIARNKFLAKLTASCKKPMQQTILRNTCIPSYLRPMDFKKIRFLGGKLGKALAEQYDASTVGDLLGVDLEEMQRKFGDNAIWVFETLRGIDRSEGARGSRISVYKQLIRQLVKEKPAQSKSMLASKNLPQPITKATEGYHWIRVLAAELALRLNNARQADPAIWPKSIVLHVRRGYETSRSKQAPFPYRSEVTVDHIASAADRLWRELVCEKDGVALKVNSVQLAFTGLETAEGGQKILDNFLKSTESKRPREAQAQDLNLYQSGRSGEDTGRADVDASGDDENSFRCARCSARISLPYDDGQPAEENPARLERLKVEHADFHFAQDLVRISPSSSGFDRGHPPRKKKKPPKESESITKYFIRK